MTTFYLVRHGEKEPSIGDPGLTAIGHRQAELTGQFLARFPISQLHASPYLRTQQTAAHIAEHLQLPVQSSDLLKERANWGQDSTQTIQEFFEMWNKATWERDYQPPVGDSSKAAGQRIEKLIERLNTESPRRSNSAVTDQQIVLVTHGGVIADFLRNIFPEERLAAIVKQFRNGKGHDVLECSVTIVQHSPTGFALTQLADTAHLN